MNDEFAFSFSQQKSIIRADQVSGLAGETTGVGRVTGPFFLGLAIHTVSSSYFCRTSLVTVEDIRHRSPPEQGNETQ